MILVILLINFLTITTEVTDSVRVENRRNIIEKADSTIMQYDKMKVRLDSLITEQNKKP